MEPYALLGDADPFAASADLFAALAGELEGPGAAGLTACELEDLLAQRGWEVQRLPVVPRVLLHQVLEHRYTFAYTYAAPVPEFAPGPPMTAFVPETAAE